MTPCLPGILQKEFVTHADSLSASNSARQEMTLATAC